MPWVQLAMLILQLLRELKGSKSLEEFSASPCAAGPLIGGNGKLIEWIWENREQLIEFIFTLIGRFGGGSSIIQSDWLVELFRELAE